MGIPIGSGITRFPGLVFRVLGILSQIKHCIVLVACEWFLAATQCSPGVNHRTSLQSGSEPPYPDLCKGLCTVYSAKYCALYYIKYIHITVQFVIHS